MAVQLLCPSLRCRKLLSVPADVRGKLVRCGHCQTTFRVPDGKRPADAPPTESAPAAKPTAA